MRRPLIRRKDFHNFHWTKKTSSKRVMKRLGKRGFIFFFLEEEENECVRG